MELVKKLKINHQLVISGCWTSIL